MSDRAAIDIAGLSKVYRLYRKPGHRFLDLFGLAPAGLLRYGEHAALDNVTLRIGRGEKVAIVGRNGAGKSTLLKIIGSVIEPTAGAARIDGELSALLSLGAGFHQDFTGRENAAAYLAQTGMNGREITAAIPGILEFAEIEDYIDQPLKTYSSGMQMRLAFAVSTAIAPDILIIDEVLSVGDAYFVAKSYERIHEMCRRAGTTPVMVTHDMHAAATICERGIWLDRGQVQIDGPVGSVIAAYEESVKQQEERRLRMRRQEALEQNRRPSTPIRFGALLPESPDQNIPELYVSGMRLRFGEVEISADMGGAEDAAFGLIASPEEGCWGALEEVQGRAARRFRAHASIFRSLPFHFEHGGTFDDETAVLEIDYLSDAPIPLRIEIREAVNLKPAAVGALLLDSQEWSSARAELGPPPEVEATAARPLSRRYGRRRMEITDVRFLDESGAERHQFPLFGTFRARLGYRLNDESFDERPTILLAFLRDGTQRTHRLFTEDLHLSAAAARTGAIEVEAGPILFGPGTYLLNVSVFAEGFMNSPGERKYFTVNEKLYDMHSRAYEIAVLPDPDQRLHNDSLLIHESRWTLET